MEQAGDAVPVAPFRSDTAKNDGGDNPQKGRRPDTKTFPFCGPDPFDSASSVERAPVAACSGDPPADLVKGGAEGGGSHPPPLSDPVSPFRNDSAESQEGRPACRGRRRGGRPRPGRGKAFPLCAPGHLVSATSVLCGPGRFDSGSSAASCPGTPGNAEAVHLSGPGRLGSGNLSGDSVLGGPGRFDSGSSVASCPGTPGNAEALDVCGPGRFDSVSSVASLPEDAILVEGGTGAEGGALRPSHVATCPEGKPALVGGGTGAEGGACLPPPPGAPLVDFGKYLSRAWGGLKIVDLKSRELGPEHAALMAAALRGNSSMERLACSDNYLVDDGAASLADALAYNVTLTSLDLGCAFPIFFFFFFSRSVLTLLCRRAPLT